MELEHETDLAVSHQRQGVGIELAEVPAVELDVSGGGHVQGSEQMEQRALARAAGADDGDELASGHREVDARQHLDREAVASLVDLPQTGGFEDRAHSWRIASTGVSPAAVREG